MPSEKVLLQKQQVVADLKAKIEGSVSGVLVDYKGIDVANDTKMRRELREAGVEYAVYKNSAIRFALAETQFSALTSCLDGTTALALSATDATAAARILSKYAKDNKNGFNIKGGFVEKYVMDAAGIEAVASIPSREVLLSQLCGGLNGVIRNLAVVLDQIREQKEAC